jgi:Fe-S-cluster containining protein
MLIETNIEIIKKLSEKKDDENWRFRSFLKGQSSGKIDSIVHTLNKEISAKIDCKICANCCKEVRPILDQEDIENFSKGLEILPDQFKDQYLIKDEEEPDKYTFNQSPCPFLKDNLCLNYSYRPECCKSFPHLHKKQLVFRLINVIDNCSVCPIVFSVYENLKRKVWRRY